MSDMTDPTLQPDSAEALAGRLTVVSWEEHERLCAIAVAREHHRMVARTADARLAVVEGVLGACQRYARPMNCGGNATRTWPLSVLACVPCKVRAVLSATAPDAGQREAQERAEVPGCFTCEADSVWVSRNMRVGLCKFHPPTKREVAVGAYVLADRSPEQP